MSMSLHPESLSWYVRQLFPRIRQRSGLIESGGFDKLKSLPS